MCCSGGILVDWFWVGDKIYTGTDDVWVVAYIWFEITGTDGDTSPVNSTGNSADEIIQEQAWHSRIHDGKLGI